MTGQKSVRRRRHQIPKLRDLLAHLGAKPRLAGVLHGGVSAFAARGLSIVVNLVTLPLMVRYLGRAEYGIWVTLSTTIMMFAVFDIGISNTLVNFIAKASANHEPAIARGYYSTAFWITVAISGVLAVVAVVVWPWINWRGLLGIGDATLGVKASECAMASVGFFLLNLPLSLANKVFSGYQKVQVANYFAMVNSILGLIAIVGGIAAHLSIVGLMIAYCFASLAGTLLLNGWLYFVSHPWIRPQVSAIRRDMAIDLFGEGLLFFVLQITGVVVFNSDNLIITHYCGPGEVTPYSVAWRLLGFATMVQALFIPALWPALSDAYHRKELSWVQSTYRRLQRTTISGVIIAALVLAYQGQWIIRIWASEAAVPSQNLLWLMALWSIVAAVCANQACLLAATQRIGLQATASVAAAILNLVLSIYLVQRIGSIGAILGTLVSYLIFVIAPQTWEVRNILRGRYMEPADAMAC